MAHAVPDILARIVGRKRAELEGLRPRRGEFEKQAAERKNVRDFQAALTARHPAIVAEFKRASPSKGAFANQCEPAEIARAYQDGGAAVLSVLTDREFFHGSLADLETARAAATLPVLRKDFTIDEVHVVEAAAHGADAILLIAAVLEEQELRRFRELAATFGMASLVEVHNAAELEIALASGATLVGVNNRNLHTFEVTLETSLCLAPKIPATVIKVAESGIHSRADIRKLAHSGFQAFLVGEHLMKSADPAAAIRELLR